MSPTVYNIDLSADTVIILKNPCSNFAPWDETLEPSYTRDTKLEDEHTAQARCFEEKTDTRKLSKKELKRLRNEASANASHTSSLETESNPAKTSHQNSYEEHDSFLEPAVQPNFEPSKSEEKEIHYLVSSRHLMLASPWFKRTLASETFTEAVKDPSDGRNYISARDWDEEAFLILLSIFHIRTRQVPATVSLELLAKIAVLVDYYELAGAEVMEREVSGWIAHVRRDPIPSSYDRDLMLWICVSQVFALSKEFEQATAVAVRESRGHIQTLDLPIHDTVTANIERNRCDAIEYVVSELHRLLDVYRDVNYSCPYDPPSSFQCGALLFGALTKQMESWGCLSPRPRAPFKGMSLNDIYAWSTGKAKLYRWHEKDICKKKREREYENSPPCSPDFKIREAIESAIAQVNGLKL